MRFFILIIGRAHDSLWCCCGCWSLPRQEHVFKEGLKGGGVLCVRVCVCVLGVLLLSIDFIT